MGFMVKALYAQKEEIIWNYNKSKNKDDDL
jgi:hypothetical protein